MSLNESSQTAVPVSTSAASPAGAVEDRRRPGRHGQVSPHLTPLLRNPATADIPELCLGQVDAPPLGYDLGPARGLVFGLVLSVPLWAIIGGVVWAVLR